VVTTVGGGAHSYGVKRGGKSGVAKQTLTLYRESGKTGSDPGKGVIVRRRLKRKEKRLIVYGGKQVGRPLDIWVGGKRLGEERRDWISTRQRKLGTKT